MFELSSPCTDVTQAVHPREEAKGAYADYQSILCRTWRVEEGAKNMPPAVGGAPLSSNLYICLIPSIVRSVPLLVRVPYIMR